MADLVQLGIVYDTAGAVTALQELEGHLADVQAKTTALTTTTTKSTTALGMSTFGMRETGHAAVILAQGLATGEISASHLTAALGRVASVALGPWGIAIGVAIGLLTLFKNNQEKAAETAAKYGDQLRTVNRAVDDLFRVGGKSPFESEVERITDLMVELQHQIDKTNRSWLGMLSAYVSEIGIHIMTPYGPIDIGGKGGKPSAEQAELGRLRRERARLTPENEAGVIGSRALDQFNFSRVIGGAQGSLESQVISERIGVLQDELKKLWEIGFRPGSEQIDMTVASLHQYVEALRKQQRAEQLVVGGLQTMADALEDFVVTGTLAFTDFLNNILRLLYRDFTGELIHGFTQSLFGGGITSGGGGGGGTQTTGSVGGTGGINGMVAAAPVNFNISTMDAQGVAQFINTHGAAIAAEVTRQAGRSAGLRRAFRRG